MRKIRVKFKKNEVALLSLILITFFVLLSFFSKKFDVLTTLNELHSKREVTKKKLAENQALYEKLVQRERSTDGLHSESMDQYLLNNDRLSSVITGIVNSSKGKSFTLTKLSLDEQSTENGYKKILYSIEAEASFLDIGKFLERLEDAPLLTEVNSVEINRIDEEMERCQTHIKLYSYVRIE